MKYILALITALSPAAVTTMEAKGGAVVRLKMISGQFFCSATVVSNTRAISAAHCFQEAPKGVTIRVFDRYETIITNAKLLGLEARSDQAVIEGDFRAFNHIAVETAPDEIINSYEKHDLLTCGYAYGGKLYCNKFTFESPDIFQMSGKAYVYPGMSGGPVIDLKTRKVVGINTAMSSSKAIVSPTIEIYQNLNVKE